MDNEKGILQIIWDFLEVSDNASAIQTIVSVLGLLGAIGGWVWFKKNKRQSGSPPPSEPMLTLTLQQFKDLNAKEIAEAEEAVKNCPRRRKNTAWAENRRTPQTGRQP